MDLTILDSQKLFGLNKLDFIEKRGLTAVISDFAILLGGFVSANHIPGGKNITDRTGSYWVKPKDDQLDVTIISAEGQLSQEMAYSRHIGSRLVGKYSDISGKREVNKQKEDVLEIEYGYYPDKAVSSDMQEKLEQLFQEGKLAETGNSYTTDSRKDTQATEFFLPQIHMEYEIDGKRYVRVLANFCFSIKKMTLSNGEEYRNGDSVWVEVSPITWLVDEEKDVMVTKKILLAGVQFHNFKRKVNNFETSDLKNFISKYFAKEIVQDKFNYLTKRTMEFFTDYEQLRAGISQMTFSQKCAFLTPLVELEEDKRKIINAFLSSLDSQLMFILENLRDEKKNNTLKEEQKVLSKKK